MLDRYTIRLLRNPLQLLARLAQRAGLTPDQISVTGFLVGMGALPLLYLQFYPLALCCIVLNRIGDGVDGSLARLTVVSDGGGFLDIVLDFVFYSGVVLGFALADQEANGLAAAALLFSFVGTGSSFLAFAVMAERRKTKSISYPHKGMYYLEGLTEGTETILFLVLFCLFPSWFAPLAYCFTVLCLITTCTRVVGGYLSLRN